MLNSWPLPHVLIAIPHPINPVKCNTGLGEIDKSFTRLYSYKITDKNHFSHKKLGQWGLSSHTEQWDKVASFDNFSYNYITSSLHCTMG